LIYGVGIYWIQNKNPQFGRKLPKAYRFPTHEWVGNYKCLPTRFISYLSKFKDGIE
jgi:hypothetical protein